MASLTSEEYKKELVERFGLNPDASSRDWEDSEHEILALLMDEMKTTIVGKINNVKEDVEENAETLDDHEKLIRDHDGWIEKRKSNLANKNRKEELNIEKGERNWTMYSVWAMVLANVVSWILIYIGAI